MVNIFEFAVLSSRLVVWQCCPFRWKLEGLQRWQIQERKNGSCKNINIGSPKSGKSWKNKILKVQIPKLAKTQLRAKEARSWKPRSGKAQNSKNAQLKFKNSKKSKLANAKLITSQLESLKHTPTQPSILTLSLSRTPSGVILVSNVAPSYIFLHPIFIFI